MEEMDGSLSSGKQDNGIVRVAAYCRTSTSHDEMTRSLENQVRHYTRLIQEQKNYKLVGIYYDRGKSGMTKEKRPGFQRLLRHCEEQRIDLILTKSVSRFSRNSKDLLEIVDHLKELGIAIYFEREKINTLELKNKFFLTALAAIAQEESRTISEITKWGFEKRFEKGIPLFQQQFGYHLHKNTNGSVLTIIEEEAAVVREVFELFNSGMTKLQIARILIDKGIKTARGSDVWTDTKVHRILTNHNYTGDKLTREKVSDFIHDVYRKNNGLEKQYLIENSHPAIISRQTFQQAQSIMEKRRAKNKPRTKKAKKREIAMSKRVICGLCNNIYHKHTTAKWACRKKLASEVLCPSEDVAETKLLGMMLAAFQERYDFTDPKVMKMMLHDIKHMNKNDHFEYQRLLFFSELEMAKEHQFNESINLPIRKREEIEEELQVFEERVTKIEADRKYRNQAIQWMDNVTSVEQFLNEVTIDYMRAWVLSIKIFSHDAYIIRWLDQEETQIGNCVVPSMPQEIKAEHDEQPTLSKTPEVPNKIEKGAFPLKEVSVIEKDPMRFYQNVKKEIEFYPIKHLEKQEPNQPKVRTAAYARISTEIAHQLGSLETQIAYYTYHILKDRNQSLVKVYADKGVSGTNTEHRQEFQRLINDCKKGKIDRIITKSISRFGRNTVDVLETVRMLKALKPPVEVVFQKEDIRTLDEDGEVMLTIYSGLAQEESRNLAESVAWGKRRLAERGKFNTKYERYGYTYDEDGNWLIHPKEGDVIRRIYKEFLTGKSTNQIAKELSEDGIVTARGKNKWHPRSIDCMITNPIYAGDLVFQRFYVEDTLTGKNLKNDGELPQYVTQNHHSAIVSRDDWEAAQRIMNNRSNKKGKSSKPHTRQEFFNIFTCSECGAPIIHISCTSDGSHYWRCRTAEKKYTEVTCDVRGFREESIEHRFMTLLQEMKMTEGYQDKMKQAFRNTVPDENERKLIGQVRNDMQQLYQQLYDEVDEGERHGGNPNKIKAITDQIVELQNQVYDYEDREQQCLKAEIDLDWFLEELKGIQEFKPEKERIEFRADIFSRIVKKGTVYPNGRIVYDLKFGVQVTTEQNDIMAWRLRKKSKPRKRKKK